MNLIAIGLILPLFFVYLLIITPLACCVWIKILLFTAAAITLEKFYKFINKTLWLE
jgi:hypothetical protein